ncbi:MAG: hypothetical protein J5760_03195, partial [Clostridia bacterium]|nr:hypothetical protein [Clostridia bacterium]
MADDGDPAAYADYDCDGVVTSQDAVYLLRHTLFPDQYPVNGFADLDGNGYVSSGDTVYLLRCVLFPADYQLPGCDALPVPTDYNGYAPFHAVYDGENTVTVSCDGIVVTALGVKVESSSNMDFYSGKWINNAISADGDPALKQNMEQAEDGGMDAAVLAYAIDYDADDFGVKMIDGDFFTMQIEPYEDPVLTLRVTAELGFEGMKY